MSDFLQPYRLQPARLLCPWNSTGKNTGVGCHALLHGIFLIQGSNLHLLCLLHCRRVLYHYHHLGSPLLATSKVEYIFLFLLIISAFMPMDYSYFCPIIYNGIFKKWFVGIHHIIFILTFCLTNIANFLLLFNLLISLDTSTNIGLIHP